MKIYLALKRAEQDQARGTSQAVLSTKVAMDEVETKRPLSSYTLPDHRAWVLHSFRREE